MKKLFVFLSAICVVGLIACAGVKKPDIKGAVDDAKGEVQKSADEVKADAEAAQAEALKTSFNESFATHDANIKGLATKIDGHEAKYQEFVGAATKKVKKDKNFKALVKEHDAALPEIQALTAAYEEALAWVEAKKEAPVAEDVTKLNEDMAAHAQKQTEALTKHGTWKATMEGIKTKYKMKVDLEIPEPEADEGAEGEGEAAEDEAAAEG